MKGSGINMSKDNSFEAIKAQLSKGDRHFGGKQDMTPPRVSLPSKGDQSKRVDRLYASDTKKGGAR